MSRIEVAKRIGIIVLVISILGVTSYLFMAYKTCPDGCINVEGELWCEMGCWNVMERHGTIPDLNEVQTDCQKYGVGCDDEK
jgi:hypothetical protein